MPTMSFPFFLTYSASDFADLLPQPVRSASIMIVVKIHAMLFFIFFSSFLNWHLVDVL